MHSKPPLPFEWTLGQKLALVAGIVAVLTLLILELTGHARDRGVSLRWTSPRAHVRVETSATRVQPRSQMLDHREFGARWPFQRPVAIVHCAYLTRKLSVELEGVRYALAGAQGLTIPPSLWRDDPTRPGQKMDLSEVIARARGVCR